MNFKEFANSLLDTDSEEKRKRINKASKRIYSLLDTKKNIDNYRGYKVYKKPLSHDRVIYKASRAGVELSANSIEQLKKMIDFKIVNKENMDI